MKEVEKKHGLGKIGWWYGRKWENKIIRSEEAKFYQASLISQSAFTIEKHSRTEYK